MVEFHKGWYKRLISKTNEKDVLVQRISDLIKNKLHDSCLEIGLGLSPYFAKNLSSNFKEYMIIEKEKTKVPLPNGAKLINSDWENFKTNQKFDVIIASHVIYYFKDKKSAIDKMFKHLAPNGRIIFVVNGKSADYGPLKLAFSEIIGEEYKFTYDKLLDLIKERKIKEYTSPSKINFDSYEELFETLKLSFDAYPKEYQSIKQKMIGYLENNVRKGQFIIDQKIIEATNE